LLQGRHLEIKMNISILIPSRGCAQSLYKRIRRHNELADKPDSIEWLIRCDSDDNDMLGYAGLSKLPNVRVLIGAPLGFAGNRYLEEVWRLAKGRYLMSLNSDADILTQGWDMDYVKALQNIPFGVAGADVDEGGPGQAENFPWCMGVVDRRICERLGQFCNGEVVDRVFCHYAKLTGRGVIAPVKIRHHFQPPKAGTPRGEFYRKIFRDPKASLAQWDAEGAEMARRVAGFV
jgi:hypothetical protein